MLRLLEPGTLEDANACLDNEYLPWWNETLTMIAANPTDAHRPLGKDHDLAAILSHVEERQINNHMIRFESRTYKIDRECIPSEHAEGTVKVEGSAGWVGCCPLCGSFMSASRSASRRCR